MDLRICREMGGDVNEVDRANPIPDPFPLERGRALATSSFCNAGS